MNGEENPDSVQGGAYYICTIGRMKFKIQNEIAMIIKHTIVLMISWIKPTTVVDFACWNDVWDILYWLKCIIKIILMCVWILFNTN